MGKGGKRKAEAAVAKDLSRSAAALDFDLDLDLDEPDKSGGGRRKTPGRVSFIDQLESHLDKELQGNDGHSPMNSSGGTMDGINQAGSTDVVPEPSSAVRSSARLRNKIGQRESKAAAASVVVGGVKSSESNSSMFTPRTLRSRGGVATTPGTASRTATATPKPSLVQLELLKLDDEDEDLPTTQEVSSSAGDAAGDLLLSPVGIGDIKNEGDGTEEAEVTFNPPPNQSMSVSISMESIKEETEPMGAPPSSSLQIIEEPAEPSRRKTRDNRKSTRKSVISISPITNADAGTSETVTVTTTATENEQSLTQDVTEIEEGASTENEVANNDNVTDSVALRTGSELVAYKNPNPYSKQLEKYTAMPAGLQLVSCVRDLENQRRLYSSSQEALHGYISTNNTLLEENKELREKSGMLKEIADKEKKRAEDAWKTLSMKATFNKASVEGAEQRHFLSEKYTEAIQKVKDDCNGRLKEIELDRNQLASQNQVLNRKISKAVKKYRSIKTTMEIQKGLVASFTQLLAKIFSKDDVDKMKRVVGEVVQEICGEQGVRVFQDCFQETWKHKGRVVKELCETFASEEGDGDELGTSSSSVGFGGPPPPKKTKTDSSSSAVKENIQPECNNNNNSNGEENDDEEEEEEEDDFVEVTLPHLLIQSGKEKLQVDQRTPPTSMPFIKKEEEEEEEDTQELEPVEDDAVKKQMAIAAVMEELVQEERKREEEKKAKAAAAAEAKKMMDAKNKEDMKKKMLEQKRQEEAKRKLAEAEAKAKKAVEEEKQREALKLKSILEKKKQNVARKLSEGKKQPEEKEKKPPTGKKIGIRVVSPKSNGSVVVADAEKQKPAPPVQNLKVEGPPPKITGNFHPSRVFGSRRGLPPSRGGGVSGRGGVGGGARAAVVVNPVRSRFANAIHEIKPVTEGAPCQKMKLEQQWKKCQASTSTKEKNGQDQGQQGRGAAGNISSGRGRSSSQSQPKRKSTYDFEELFGKEGNDDNDVSSTTKDEKPQQRSDSKLGVRPAAKSAEKKDNCDDANGKPNVKDKVAPSPAKPPVAVVHKTATAAGGKNIYSEISNDLDLSDSNEESSDSEDDDDDDENGSKSSSAGAEEGCGEEIMEDSPASPTPESNWGTEDNAALDLIPIQLKVDGDLHRFLSQLVNTPLTDLLDKPSALSKFPSTTTCQQVARSIYAIVAQTSPIHLQKNTVTDERLSRCPLLPRFAAILMLMRDLRTLYPGKYADIFLEFGRFFCAKMGEMEGPKQMENEKVLVHIGRLFGAIQTLGFDVDDVIVTMAGVKGPLFYSFFYGILANNSELLGFVQRVTDWAELKLWVRAIVVSVVKGPAFSYSKWRATLVGFLKNVVGVTEVIPEELGFEQAFRTMLKEICNIESDGELKKGARLIGMLGGQKGLPWFVSALPGLIREYEGLWKEGKISDGFFSEAFLKGVGLVISWMRKENLPENLDGVKGQLRRFMEAQYPKLIRDAASSTLHSLENMALRPPNQEVEFWRYERIDGGRGREVKVNKKKSAEKRKRQRVSRKAKKKKLQGGEKCPGGGGGRNSGRAPAAATNLQLSESDEDEEGTGDSKLLKLEEEFLTVVPPGPSAGTGGGWWGMNRK